MDSSGNVVAGGDMAGTDGAGGCVYVWRAGCAGAAGVRCGSVGICTCCVGGGVNALAGSDLRGGGGGAALLLGGGGGGILERCGND